MKKLFLVLIVLMAVSGITYAQELTKEQKAALKEQQKADKKEAKRIKSVVKEALEMTETNAKGAESKLKEALTNKFTKDAPETWNIAGKIQLKINEGESQKNYLKQPYDTILFHNSLYNMYTNFLKCDELEQIPDKKGKVEHKYRVANAEIMNQYRQNLIVGGIYFFNGNKNPDAYRFFSMYIDLGYAPMMESYNLQNDSLNFLVAYYACLSGIKEKNYNQVLKYADMAILDPENGENAIQYKAMAEKELGDSAEWLKTLKQGAEEYPENQYFYQELISHYDAIGNMNQLTQFADDMIRRNPFNSYFWYVKGYIYQSMYQKSKNYDESLPLYEKAIEYYSKAIELNPEYVNALNNLGLCYWEQARAYNEQKATNDFKSAQYKKDKEIIKSIYKKALPIFEKLRILKPDDQKLWTNGLYTCYYNLEMGKELKEIEKLMPK